MIIFNLSIFLIILFIFGWFFVRYFLKENRIFVIIPLSILLGLSAYIFLLNVISYFVPVQFSFWLVLGILIFITLFFLIIYRKENKEGLILGISSRWFWIIAFVFLSISISNLIVGLRSLENDTLVYVHIPTAATIAEGNFPIKDAHNPSDLFNYHYAAELFSAAIYRITGLPIDFAYDVQIGLGAGLIFLISFILAYSLLKKSLPAFLTGLFALFGSGLNFLNVFRGFPVLYNKFILGKDIEAPFKFVNHVIYGESVNSAAVWIQNHSTAIGLPVILGVIYFYFRAIQSKNRYWLRFTLVAGLLFGYSALSIETFFSLMAVILIAYPLRLLFFSHQKTKIKRTFAVSFLILGIGLLIAFYQGGVLTYSKGAIGSGQNFILGLKSIETVLGAKPFYSFSFSFLVWFFLREFGLPLLLFVPALIYFKKDKRIFAFLGLSAIIPFILPFIVTYVNSPGSTEYFFIASIVFLSLISGLYLGSLILKAKLQKRKTFTAFLSVISFIIILNGLIYQIMFMFYPFGNLSREPHPFLAKLPEASELEKKTNLWIKGQTTIQDIFFLTREENFFSDLKYPLNPLFFNSNSDFIAAYGRLALTLPSPFLQSPYPNLQSPPSKEKLLQFEKIKKGCDSQAIREFNIKYIYVVPQWPEGLEERCLAKNDLELKFSQALDKEFVRIYLVR